MPKRKKRRRKRKKHRTALAVVTKPSAVVTAPPAPPPLSLRVGSCLRSPLKCRKVKRSTDRPRYKRPRQRKTNHLPPKWTAGSKGGHLPHLRYKGAQPAGREPPHRQEFAEDQGRRHPLQPRSRSRQPDSHQPFYPHRRPRHPEKKASRHRHPQCRRKRRRHRHPQYQQEGRRHRHPQRRHHQSNKDQP